MDLATLEKDVQAIIDEAKVALPAIETLATVLTPFLPAAQAGAIGTAIALMKGVTQGAPNLAADLNAVVKDVQGILAALQG